MLDQLTRIGAKVEIGGPREIGTPKILSLCWDLCRFYIGRYVT